MNAARNLLPWFRLFRLPNLLTVPGDPVAGFLLAAGTGLTRNHLLPLLAAAGASLGLYVFGLILNDLLDVATDARERPDRPLPAGEITVPQARMAAIAAALSGLNLAATAGRAALLTAAALAGLIVLYNAVLKRIPVVGVLTMGLCRGLSLMVGAVTACPGLWTQPDVSRLPVLLAAAGLSLYVAAFSVLALREAEPDAVRHPSVRWLPLITLSFTLPTLFAMMAAQGRIGSGIGPAFGVFLMTLALLQAWLTGGPLHSVLPVPELVGRHICNLLRVQACFCAATGIGGILPAVCLTALSFAFVPLAKRFYSS
ncbi:MAG TPA: UbiA family prenyltransferase [Kiritimatiellia bacterium]|jgi:4-hydroxybenzoate polyprenyltransferase|nr:UbiA family prenyltransferase [Kiritimatiellia bacterium]HPW76223.1 UbiA family prenyltransferase [Kiritimatiellia bacterium]